MQINPITRDLLTFIDHSPTSWHAAHEAKKKLQENGFTELKESEEWNILPGQGYFTLRNGSSICAFIVPHKKPRKARILASHTDSPCLKLKPQPEIRKHNMVLFGVEIYGAPLLSSWLNRDLGIAGRVLYYNSHNDIETQLVRIDNAPLTIPQLAIHLDREVNEKGLILNKQEHLNALAALLDNSWDDKENYLDILLRQKIDYKKLLNFDLFLFPLEPAKLSGYNQQMISAYRLDNLTSLHASLTAFLSKSDPLQEDIKLFMSWDNEEVGSNTLQGASSTFASQILERIMLSCKLGRQEYLQLLNQSLCVSIDLTHAVHPNYIEKHDPNHLILLSKGVALKTNAQFRYASDSISSIPIHIAAEQTNLPLQKFVSRNDIPCGTTIGPIHSTLCGMPTVDIGCAQLSMHACRELIATQDYLDLCRLLESILSSPH